MIKLALYIFIGSGLGGVCRYLASEGIFRLIQSLCTHYRHSLIFPFGTFFVNIVGCFIIGLIYGAISRGVEMSAEMRLFLTAGFCGGLTTFSTFSHDNYILFQGNHLGILFIYIISSLAIGLLAAYGGHYLLDR